MTIKSSNIYIVAAAPGTGKTFTGDYLDHVHGFTHIDGDQTLRNLHIQKNQQLFAGIVEAGLLNKQNRDIPETLWRPYYQDLIDRTLEAANTSNKVVVTFAMFTQKERDFLMTKLKEGGVQCPKLIFLTMDKDLNMEGLYHRTKRQLKAMDMTLEDYFESEGWKPDYDGDGNRDVSLEEFKILFKKYNPFVFQPFDDPPLYAKVVDVTLRDVTVLNAIDTVIGLDRNPELSYKEIVHDVFTIDHERDRDTPYSLKEWDEIVEEINDKIEKERELIMKRRSTLMSVNRQPELTRLFISSDSDSVVV